MPILWLIPKDTCLLIQIHLGEFVQISSSFLPLLCKAPMLEHCRRRDFVAIDLQINPHVVYSVFLMHFEY